MRLGHDGGREIGLSAQKHFLHFAVHQISLAGRRGGHYALPVGTWAAPIREAQRFKGLKRRYPRAANQMEIERDEGPEDVAEEPRVAVGWIPLEGLPFRGVQDVPRHERGRHVRALSERAVDRRPRRRGEGRCGCPSSSLSCR